ncbi:SEL1-like repeat protein [Methyloraptor flagellatus]|jgi:TPR repeat protein|uniref:SEL1-like repeat protein n=1 Tax=Methyloraptor flagellatus TaxID=3162530 RepID=A0AAU7XD23_9HYPH
MARFEIQEAEMAVMGQQNLSPEIYFQLGISYSTGRGVDADMIAAHKWFNLAAAQGKSEAAQYRQDVAREMSSADIAEAQRQAREHLAMMTRH